MDINEPIAPSRPNNNINLESNITIDRDNINLRNDNCMLALKNYESTLIRETTIKINKEKQRQLKEKLFSKEEIHRRTSSTTKIEFLCIKNLLILAKNSICKDNTPIEVVPNIFIGSIGTACHKDNLNLSGITHIISCLDVKFTPFSNDFVYKNIPILDSSTENINHYFDLTNKFIEDT